MKVLSIDVGMKNLAFCLFEIKDSMEYQIIKWDVLNLCRDKEHFCKELKKIKNLVIKKPNTLKMDVTIAKLTQKIKNT